MLAELQRVLVDCCTADDPLAAMAAAAQRQRSLAVLRTSGAENRVASS